MNRKTPPGGMSAPVAPAPQSSYNPNMGSVNFDRSNRPRNFSPTAPPSVAVDVGCWPAWTEIPVDRLNFDCFDAHGNPLFDERGV
jgi:hypothetical protein